MDLMLPLTRDEKAFFRALGSRLAQLRREQGLTQTEIAAHLGVSQQTINSFEKGRRRVPSSALPTLARVLSVSLEDLLGAGKPPSKRGPAPKLQQQIARISELPRTKQRFVAEMLDTVLQQASR